MEAQRRLSIRSELRTYNSQLADAAKDGRPSRSRETSTRARLDDGLFAALSSSVFRANIRRLLVSTYFPPAEQVALFSALGFEGAAESPEITALAEDQATYRLARETGRSARFKNEVVTGYRFTCALTGYRLTTINQAGIVEAAHIHQLVSGDPEVIIFRRLGIRHFFSGYSSPFLLVRN